ncbi:MAG: glycosyltransferase family 1 protein [Deltaproteobacteria bacterium]|nr:MAG: glycosyltransferase family 1 protein [Deltaproteobacteria bacterium]
MKGRILIVEGAHNIGGSFTSIEIVLRWGMRRGLSFDVISAVDLRELLPEGVGWFPMPAPLRYPISRLKFVGLILSQNAIVSYRLWRNQYDAIILNNTVNNNLPALLAGRFQNTPMLQYIRDFERDSRGWRYCQGHVDKFVAVSPSIKEDMVQRLRIPASRILLAPEGIAPREPVTGPQRSFLRQMFGLPDDADVIGFVGRLDWWKGYELFVEAAIQAAQENPNLYAVMVGGASRGQESIVERLKVQISNAGVHDRVRIVGEVAPDEVDGWVRCMDVLVHTSITPEPFGRVLLEAMTIGVPVISSSEGGPRDIVVDGETGRLTPPKDPKALAEAITWTFADPDRPAALGRNARERCTNVYPEAVCALPPLEWIRRVQIDRQQN